MEKAKVYFCKEITPDNVIKRVDTIVLSTQHDPEAAQEQIRKDCCEYVINEVFNNTNLIDDKTIIHINPTGKFTIGGPHGDTGLTGRKIVVDSYGGKAPHGGGAFSGKDPTKVDRSAAYMARYLAKNIVAAGLSDECTIQLSYAIGIPDPVAVYVSLHDNKKRDLEIELSKFIKNNIPLDPKSMINTLQLRTPIYRKTTNYGHFGKSYLPWEKLDLVDKFNKVK